MQLTASYIVAGARRRLRSASLSALGGSLSCESYVEKFGEKTIQILPSFDVEHPLPVNIDASELPARRDDWGMSFVDAHRRSVRAARLHMIQNVDVIVERDRFLNDFYYLFGQRRRLIETSGGGHVLQAALRAQLGRPKRSIDAGAWILDPWYPNYFHWIILHLAKIAALQRIGWDGPIIGPAAHWRATGYLWDSLSLMGVRPEKIVEAPAERFVIKDAAIVDIDFLDARLLDDVRRLMWSNRTLKPHRRLYVKRSERGLRRLINGDEVERLLVDHGFEIVDAARLTLPQQVALFTEAATIIGVHGAGLSNMLFAAPGAAVIELSDLSVFPNPFYFALSGELGHRYTHAPCVAVSRSQQPVLYWDLHVDPARLSGILRLL